MNRKEDWEDDGRTIADMSGISRPPLLIPRFRKTSDTPQKPAGQDTGLSRKERGYAALGATMAALLIAMVFMAGIGIAILLMLIFWT